MIEPSRPFFSIIIPTYNVERYITRALESVFSQTFKNFEVLVIDGKSTDNTLSLLSSYQKNDTRIKVISEEDKGIYDAINKGIDFSSGKYLYFLGADDHLFMEDTLEQVYKEILKTTADVIYGNVNSPTLGNDYNGKFNFETLAYKNICHQSIFFNSAIFKKTGKFNLKYNVHADWDHNLKWFFNHSIKTVYLSKTIAFYDGNGYSSVSKDTRFKRDFTFLFYKYAKQHLSLFKIIKILAKGFIKKMKNNS